MNETQRKILGFSEVAKDATSLSYFDALFIDEPECEFLTPPLMTKQAVSRKVFRPGFRTHNIGYFASRINLALITFESSLEKHACTVFESYPEVQSYKSQPYGVGLFFLDKFRTVYPDFELVLKDHSALVDIRYIDNINSPKFKARYWALKQYAEQRGINYILLTEKELHTQRKDNSRFLLSLCRGTPHKRLVNKTAAWLQTRLPIKFRELLILTNAYPSVRAVIAGFILDGVLPIDWDKPIHMQTLSFSGNVSEGSWLG